MENLEIRDKYNDFLVLSSDIDGEAAIQMCSDSDLVIVKEQDARDMVAWLQECFGLQQELTALASGPTLEINVETETGKIRTVRWEGPDIPAALLELAGAALRTSAAPAPGDCEHLRTLRGVYNLVEGLGLTPQVGAYAAVAALVKAYRTLRREPAPAVVPPPLRQAMETLGLERADQLPGRIDSLITEVNGVAAALASATGTSIGPNGASLTGLVQLLKNQHMRARPARPSARTVPV